MEKTGVPIFRIRLEIYYRALLVGFGKLLSTYLHVYILGLALGTLA